MEKYNRQYAEALRQQKNYDELFTYVSKFKNSNSPEALTMLSDCYYFGLGTKKDHVLCFECDSLAAETGNADSIAALGYDFEWGVGVDVNFDKAVELYEKSSSMGSTKGSTYLGTCYEYGTGVEKDVKKAFDLYQHAAELGYAKAQRLLGTCFENGIGVEVDKAKAVEWYLKSAMQDNEIAQRYLAICYENGEGVEVDQEKAVEWYFKSANLDDKISQREIGTRFYHGNGVEKNLDKAAEWLKKAADQDDAIAMVYLSTIYMCDEESKAKQIEAFKYLQSVVTLRDEKDYFYYLACECLADFYMSGLGDIEIDLRKAFDFYQIAAEGNIESAILNLAACYEKGNGVAPDSRKAIELYEKGVDSIGDLLNRAECYTTLGDLCSEFDEDVMQRKSDEYFTKARHLYEELTSQGDSEAELQLGRMYYKGKGVQKDGGKAFSIFEKAVRNTNDGISKYYLARCYLRGVGVDVNLKKAFALFKSAALDDGHILSHLFLIYCYQHGLGTRADYKVANKLMLEIETISERENGEYSGYINLYKGISYYHGVGIKKDIQKAASYFRQSKGLGSILYAPICEGDFSKADLLGLIYSRASLTEGFLIYTDEERARHFLMLAYRNDCISETGAITLNALLRKTRANKRDRRYAFDVVSSEMQSEKNNAQRQRILGQHFYYGYGIKQDYAKALSYFEKACSTGDDLARVYVAICYANGRGVEVNLETARNTLECAPGLRGNISNALLGMLIYAGSWGFEKNRDKGLNILQDTRKIPRYNYYFELLSSLRGEAYTSLLLDNFFSSLHFSFDPSKRSKYRFGQLYRAIGLLLLKNPNSTNLSKKEILQMLLDQRKEQIENQDAILGILSHISSNTDLISEIRDDQIAVIENLRTILEYVTEQKNSMPDERTLRFLDEEQIELVREKFIHETAQRIINTLQEDIPSIDHEEGLLKEMFGTYWDKLDTYTRKALISAKVFFANCNRATYAVLDYSGIIVSATSALENELKRRFFTGYQKYLFSTCGTPSDGMWPESMLFYNRQGKAVKNNNFTLGSMPYIF